MIKKIAWDTFKKTGDINTFLELKQIMDIEENIKMEQINNENSKGKWHNNSRENGSRF